MARTPLKTPGRTLLREVALSASAMFLAILLPQILLLLIWKNPLSSLPWLFPIANNTHRYFELLAALIPLTILEGVVGTIFMMDFEKKLTHLRNFYAVCLVLPVVGLQLLSLAFVGLALNYKDETMPSLEYYLVSGMVFIGVIMLFTADGFMAAARAELRHTLRAPRYPALRIPRNASS